MANLLPEWTFDCSRKRPRRPTLRSVAILLKRQNWFSIICGLVDLLPNDTPVIRICTCTFSVSSGSGCKHNQAGSIWTPLNAEDPQKRIFAGTTAIWTVHYGITPAQHFLEKPKDHQSSTPSKHHPPFSSRNEKHLISPSWWLSIRFT